MNPSTNDRTPGGGAIFLHNETFDAALRRNVHDALAEDIGRCDWTAMLVQEGKRVSAQVVAKEAAVICGRPWFDACFVALDPHSTIEWNCSEGQSVEGGTVVCCIESQARALLSAERTALNFLQSLSGVAGVTRSYVQAIEGLSPNPRGCAVLDTRKTLPGLRQAQKYAVRIGGGKNHRMALWDGILIKENHIAAAGGIAAALEAARQLQSGVDIQIEVENLAEMQEALDAGASHVLIDDFSLDDMQRAVAMNAGRAQLEVSGGGGLADDTADCRHRRGSDLDRKADKGRKSGRSFNAGDERAAWLSAVVTLGHGARASAIPVLKVDSRLSASEIADRGRLARVCVMFKRLQRDLRTAFSHGLEHTAPLVVGVPERNSVPLPDFISHRPVFTARYADEHADPVGVLAADEAVDAIFLNSSRPGLLRDVWTAVQAGKHVLLEVSSHVSPEVANQVQACHSSSDVLILAAHSHSYDPIYLQAKNLLDSGEFGSVELIAGMSYSSDIPRPGQPRIDVDQLYLQSDLVRLLGGPVARVRLCAPACRVRRGDDRYIATFWLAAGGVASMTYGGHGRFSSDEWCGGTDRQGLPVAAPFDLLAMPSKSRHIGPVLVSCQDADLRPTPDGVHVYRDGGLRVVSTVLGPGSCIAGMASDLKRYLSDGVRPMFDAAWMRDTLYLRSALRRSLDADMEVALRSGGIDVSPDPPTVVA
jgi:nicotinate-nucleotide pyrophosphorylase (carboxylating)